MSNLTREIAQFIANHKQFPTAVDLKRSNKSIWEQLTPQETWEFLCKVTSASNIAEYASSEYDIAFQYWLYWLQAERFRVTNGIMAVILTTEFGCSTMPLTISRLKAGRRMPKSNEIGAFYSLYLMSPEQRKQLKEKVLR